LTFDNLKVIIVIARGDNREVFKIVFYKNIHGEQPVKDYILELSNNTDKDSRIKLNKIQDYMGVLSNSGTRAGTPYVKHIDGGIWELRPLRDRIFFFCWKGDSFVLLHQFVKKTQTTPQREIDQAKRNLSDFIERSSNNEK